METKKSNPTKKDNGLKVTVKNIKTSKDSVMTPTNLNRIGITSPGLNSAKNLNFQKKQLRTLDTFILIF